MGVEARDSPFGRQAAGRMGERLEQGTVPCSRDIGGSGERDSLLVGRTARWAPKQGTVLARRGSERP